MKHLLFILLIIAIIVTGIFLPYVHGDYDYFAVGLSSIFQFAGFASLLLVPIGLVWSIMDISYRGTGKKAYPGYFRKMALAVTVIIIIAAALGALASHNRFSAIIILGAGLYIILKILAIIESSS
jgi:hypothetical protein